MRQALPANSNFGWHPIALAVAAALHCGFSVLGQSPANANSVAGQPQAGTFTLRTESDLVFLPARVQTKNGEPIYGLTADQFVVEDNGVPQTITVEDDPTSTGLSLVLAVQCGRSAPEEFNKLKGLSTMIDAIVGATPHEVAVLTYGEKPYVLGDFSADSDAIPLALSKLRPCGDYHAVSIDAVYYAINMLKRRQNNYRRAILLISESRDYGSRARLEEVVAQLGVTNTMIYSVTFSPARQELIRPFRDDESPSQASIFPAPPASAPKPNPAAESNSSTATSTEPLYTEHPPMLLLPPAVQVLINALKRNAASELADLSGGEQIDFTTQRGFEAGLHRISNQIHDYYVLSFKPSRAAPMSVHSLRIYVPGYPDAVIQSRRSYLSGMPAGGP